MRAWAARENGVRRLISVWHRRAGKDEVGLHGTACAAHQRVGTYWHLLPEATQARKAIWDAINPRTGKRRIDEAFPVELRDTTRDQDMFIRFKVGSTWQVVGSDNYDSLVGTPPIGIVFSEWALAHPHAWSYLRPILQENGGWAHFIFTPRGRNHAADLYDAHKDDHDWFVEKLSAADTGVFTPEQLATELAEYKLELGDREGEALYRQEYLCDFDAPVIGAVYAGLLADMEKDNRFTDIEWNPGQPVYSCWDIGRRDATAVWFYQVGPGAVYWIDYEEAVGTDVPYWVKRLKDKPYAYSQHQFPWDARLSTFAAPRSVLHQFADHGIHIKIVGDAPAADRIGAGRIVLRRSYFDKKRCAGGLKHLRDYHYKWDDKARALSKEPFHGVESHAADAFGIGAIAYKDINPAPFKTNDLNLLPTLGEITAMHDRDQNYRDRRIA